MGKPLKRSIVDFRQELWKKHRERRRRRWECSSTFKRPFSILTIFFSFLSFILFFSLLIRWLILHITANPMMMWMGVAVRMENGSRGSRVEIEQLNIREERVGSWMNVRSFVRSRIVRMDAKRFRMFCFLLRHEYFICSKSDWCAFLWNREKSFISSFSWFGRCYRCCCFLFTFASLSRSIGGKIFVLKHFYDSSTAVRTFSYPLIIISMLLLLFTICLRPTLTSTMMLLLKIDTLNSSVVQSWKLAVAVPPPYVMCCEWIWSEHKKKYFFEIKLRTRFIYVREMSKWRGVRDLLIKNCWIFNNCTHMNMNQSNNEITYKSNNEKKFNYNFYWIFLVLRFFHNVEIVSVNWLWLFLLASAWYWFQFRRHSNLTLNKNKELHRLDP